MLRTSDRRRPKLYRGRRRCVDRGGRVRSVSLLPDAIFTERLQDAIGERGVDRFEEVEGDQTDGVALPDELTAPGVGNLYPQALWREA